MKKTLFSILYWFISLTWGIIMTTVGFVSAGFCMLFLKGKAHRNGNTFIIEVGLNWGGVSLGPVALCGSYYTNNLINTYDHVRKHEFGHSLQHLMFGPLFPFVISIPSMCRYWHQVYLFKKKNIYLDDTWYDSVWFEGTATKWGTAMINYLEKK